MLAMLEEKNSSSRVAACSAAIERVWLVWFWSAFCKKLNWMMERATSGINVINKDTMMSFKLIVLEMTGTRIVSRAMMNTIPMPRSMSGANDGRAVSGSWARGKRTLTAEEVEAKPMPAITPKSLLRPTRNVPDINTPVTIIMTAAGKPVSATRKERASNPNPRTVNGRKIVWFSPIAMICVSKDNESRNSIKNAPATINAW